MEATGLFVLLASLLAAVVLTVIVITSWFVALQQASRNSGTWWRQPAAAHVFGGAPGIVLCIILIALTQCVTILGGCIIPSSAITWLDLHSPALVLLLLATWPAGTLLYRWRQRQL